MPNFVKHILENLARLLAEYMIYEGYLCNDETIDICAFLTTKKAMDEAKEIVLHSHENEPYIDFIRFVHDEKNRKLVQQEYKKIKGKTIGKGAVSIANVEGGELSIKGEKDKNRNKK